MHLSLPAELPVCRYTKGQVNFLQAISVVGNLYTAYGVNGGC